MFCCNWPSSWGSTGKLSSWILPCCWAWFMAASRVCSSRSSRVKVASTSRAPIDWRTIWRFRAQRTSEASRTGSLVSSLASSRVVAMVRISHRLTWSLSNWRKTRSCCIWVSAWFNSSARRGDWLARNWPSLPTSSWPKRVSSCSRSSLLAWVAITVAESTTE